MINLDERDRMAGNNVGAMLANYMNRNRIPLEGLPSCLVISMPPPLGGHNMMKPPNGMMIPANPNEINNNMKNMNQIGMNNNMCMINLAQNQINNNDCFNIKEINTKEKSLMYFFNFISFENNEKLNFRGSKLIINYYGLKKSEVYIDLNLKVDEIISNIYYQLFSSIFKKEEHKRTESNQTTEFIIKNPIYVMDKEDCPFEYSNFLYLLYNNQDISVYANYTGRQIGLNYGSEIFLRIKDEFYHDIIKFPKIPVYILFQTYNVTVEKDFPLNQGFYNTLEKIKKLFNNNNFRVNVNIDGFNPNVQLITENCELILERKKIGGAGPAINFVDVEGGKITNLNLSTNTPLWRKIDKGLNIFGICGNSMCIAFNKEVIHKTVLAKDGLAFNLNEKITEIKCPICKKIINPTSCGFYDCEYQFIGKKIVNGDICNFDSKTRETIGNQFEYFGILGNGQIIWIELFIYVLPKQSIKYLPN